MLMKGFGGCVMDNTNELMMLEKRRQYISLEKERQQIANAVVFNKDKFLALYGSGAFELFDYRKTNLRFYLRSQFDFSDYKKDAKASWRFRTVLEMIPGGEALKALSAGSGWEGIFSTLAFVERPLLEISAVDILPPENYKGPPSTKYFQGSICDMSFFPGECFDLIVCMEALEHLPPTIVMDAWKEFNRVLKPNGTIILTVPYTEALDNFIMCCPICCEWVSESGHVRSYPPSVVRAEANVNGFEIIEIIKGKENINVYKGIKRA